MVEQIFPESRSVNILQIEIDTFNQNRSKLRAKDPGKFVLIKGTKIITTMDTERDAVTSGYQRFGNAPFLVKEITDVDIPLEYGHKFWLTFTPQSLNHT